MNKDNLKIILNTKYTLLDSLKTIQRFFSQVGLNIQNKTFYKQVLSCDLDFFDKTISKIVKSRRK
jgi:hypothetical protein